MSGIIAGIVAIPVLLAIVIIGPQLSGVAWAVIAFYVLGFSALSIQRRA